MSPRPAPLVFFALATATPLTIVSAAVPGAYAGGGPLALPLLFAGLGLLLLAGIPGYARMAHRLPHAGALSGFVARGLGRPFGVGAGWLALLSYNALQIGLYGVVGATAAPLVRAPWWTVALACWAVVAVSGLVRVEVTAWALAALVLAEIAVICGYAVANLLDPPGGRLTTAALDPAYLGVSRPVLGLLLVAGALAFVGFETTAAYSEEVRPHRRIGRAAALSVLVLTLLYAAASWAMTVAAGPDRIAARAAERGPELIFDLAAARFVPGAVTAGRIVLVTGLLAAMLALHHTVVRYLVGLARERVLPAGLSRVRPASLTQSLTAGLVIAGGVLAGLGPVAPLGQRLALGGGLGVLLLLTLASLATLLFLNRDPEGEGFLRRFVSPGVSTVVFGALSYLAYQHFRELMIVSAAAFVLGVAYALVLRAVRPVVYAGIGLGGRAVVVTPPAVPVPRPRLPGAHRPERVKRLAG
ncbi:APC family permease [Nucisporomicrobium flavum]|uniref:APC family permease n=1 Tax=Nucisporomicrobium flavum TaxID=2785915 RepID=UPI0018F2A3C2|nr:amino acid permease [Nucisporomicrobium flavum]